QVDVVGRGDAGGDEVGAGAVDDLVDGERADVVPVEPVELGQVEPRSGDAKAVEGEDRDDVVDTEHLAAVGHREAHQREEVDQRLRQVALFAEPTQVRPGVLALRDAAFVDVPQQRHVRQL